MSDQRNGKNLSLDDVRQQVKLVQHPHSVYGRGGNHLTTTHVKLYGRIQTTTKNYLQMESAVTHHHFLEKDHETVFDENLIGQEFSDANQCDGEATVCQISESWRHPDARPSREYFENRRSQRSAVLPHQKTTGIQIPLRIIPGGSGSSAAAVLPTVMTAAITAAIPPAETVTPHPMTPQPSDDNRDDRYDGPGDASDDDTGDDSSGSSDSDDRKIPATGRIPPETVIPEAIGMMTGGIILENNED